MTEESSARTCIFCGSEGDMSREHVLRDKWRNVLGIFNGEFVDRHTFGTGEAGKSSSTSYPGTLFTRTVKRVCKACNNGWMNDLENVAESLVHSMVEGRGVCATSEELASLNRWLAKTNFVMEFMDRGVKTATIEQRQAVMCGARVPRFSAFAFALEFNCNVRLRSSVVEWQSPEGEDGLSSTRISSIQFFQVHFLCFTSSTVHADELSRGATQDYSFLGQCLSDPSESLEWLGSQEKSPLAGAQVTHDSVFLMNLQASP